MRLTIRSLCMLALVTLILSVNVFAGKTAKSGSRHIASGTISSIDDNHVVISEKIKGKEQPVTFNMDSSTQKSGNLQAGALVTIQYRTENSQNVATAVRERSPDPAATKKSSK
jgi:hypothetical protein